MPARSSNWMAQHLPVDGPTAKVFAAGMKAVAKADGDVHRDELALIQAFEEGLPDGPAPEARAALVLGDLRAAYVRSLVMVGLADGVLSDDELAVIRGLSASVGVEAEELERHVDEVKRWFISRFAGVQTFRDAVVRIAQDLGLDPDDVLDPPTP